MSYGPPMAQPMPAAVPPMPPVPPQPPRTGGGLPAVAVLVIVQLLLEFAVLGFDLDREGLAYLPTALGLSYSHLPDAPVAFLGSDTALCLGLIVTAIGALARGQWARPAAVALLGLNAYTSAANLLNEIGNSATRNGLTSPFSNLLLNLNQLTAVLLALVLAIVVAATRRPADASYPMR